MAEHDESADDDVAVALYRQGFSLERIARATHRSRDTIRRIVVEAGVPIRPPRAFRPEEVERAVYPPDHPSTPIAARLRAEDAAARTTWAELHRPVIRGHWQTVLLDALETENSVGLLVTAEAHLGRSLTRQEADAVRKAARHLALSGAVDLHHVTRSDGTGPKRARIVITRPGAAITPRRQQQINHAAVSAEKPTYPPADQAGVSRKLIRQLQRVIHTSHLLQPELLGATAAGQLFAVIDDATRQLADLKQGISANARTGPPSTRP